jgi:hypothetical protein
VLDFSITRFLVMMAFEPTLRRSFWANREAAMRGWGLSEQEKAILRKGDLTEIKEAMSTQSGDLAQRIRLLRSRGRKTKRRSAKKK